MALPSNVGFGTVTWHSMDSLGVNVEGSVTFTPSPSSIKNVTALPPVTILPTPVTVALSNGALPVTQLIATDDPDNNPAGWTYAVSFALKGGVRLASFSFELHEGAAVDLTTVIPVAQANGQAITRGIGVEPGGLTGQVLAKASDADYDTTWVAQSGGGTGGAVDSVNGETGAVTLTAADVGALPDSTSIPSTPADIGAATAAQGTKADTAVQPAALTGYVPTSRTVAGKALTGNVTLAATDVGALPDTTSIPSTAADVGAVPTSRTIAGLDLTANRTVAELIAALGPLTLANNAPGTDFQVEYDGTNWSYAGTVVTARPTARTDLTMQCVNTIDTTTPSWALPKDQFLRVG